jgi:uncharacterized protein YjbJ (UPF0337 family)
LAADAIVRRSAMLPTSVRSHEMGINKDQVDGRVKEATGKIEEVAGRVTGSPTRELKGKIKKHVGAVQADYGDAKERNKEQEKNEARHDRP